MRGLTVFESGFWRMHLTSPRAFSHKSFQLRECLFRPLQGLLADNSKPLTNRNANFIKKQHI
jgi:hypothetical protein